MSAAPRLVVNRGAVDFGAGAVIQSSLHFTTPGDVYEREADRIADLVMQGGARVVADGSPAGLQREGFRGGLAQRILHRSGTMVARQPQTQGRAITQADYDAAVGLLQNRGPGMIYTYLHGRQLGRQAAVERLRLPHPQAASGGPSTVEIRFQVSVRRLPGGAGTPRAYFSPTAATSSRTSPSTVRVDQVLPITLHNLEPGDTTVDLAATLYHEGVHMLLHRDRLLQRWAPGQRGRQSGLLAELERTRARARAFANYSGIVTQVVHLIQQYGAGTRGTPPSLQSAQRDAGIVMDTFLEEWLARSREETAFPGRPAAPLFGWTIARLREGLDRVGVHAIGRGRGAVRTAVRNYPGLRQLILDLAALVRHLAPAAATPATPRGTAPPRPPGR